MHGHWWPWDRAAQCGCGEWKDVTAASPKATPPSAPGNGLSAAVPTAAPSPDLTAGRLVAAGVDTLIGQK